MKSEKPLPKQHKTLNLQAPKPRYQTLLSGPSAALPAWCGLRRTGCPSRQDPPHTYEPHVPACIYVLNQLCVYTYIHTYMHAYIHTYMHACMHTYIHTYMHTYVHAYLRTYVRTYIPTYVRTYIHTYIRTYIHRYGYRYALRECTCPHTWGNHIYIYIYIHICICAYTCTRGSQRYAGPLLAPSSKKMKALIGSGQNYCPQQWGKSSIGTRSIVGTPKDGPFAFDKAPNNSRETNSASISCSIFCPFDSLLFGVNPHVPM